MTEAIDPDRDNATAAIYKTMVVEYPGLDFFALVWRKGFIGDAKTTQSMMPDDTAGLLRYLADAIDAQAADDLAANS